MYVNLIMGFMTKCGWKWGEGLVDKVTEREKVLEEEVVFIEKVGIFAMRYVSSQGRT